MGFLSKPLRRNHPSLAALDRFSNFPLLSTPRQFHKNRQRRSRYVHRFISSCPRLTGSLPFHRYWADSGPQRYDGHRHFISNEEPKDHFSR
jgi:hypothetical protein